MTYISLTRLQLRGFLFLPRFILWNNPITKEIQKAPGFLKGKLLIDAGWNFWTLTVWKNKESVLAFRNHGVYLKAIPKLAEWAKQAAVTHWEQKGMRTPCWLKFYCFQFK